jgi:hypothetical protein
VDLVEGYVQLAPLGNYLRIHDGDTHRDIREKLAGKLVVSILSHLGEPIRPPQPAPARGPPLWEQAGQCDHTAPPPPEFVFDQRLGW